MLMSLINLRLHVRSDMDFYGLAKLGKGRQDPCKQSNDLYQMSG